MASSAKRNMLRLPEAVAAAVYQFMAADLGENPQRVGKALVGPLASYHSARRGTYRLVYKIDDEAKTVCVIAVEHRGDVYRRR